MRQDKHLLFATNQATGQPLAFSVYQDVAMIRGFVLFLCLTGLPLAAIPCSIRGLEHEIEFEPQSAALGTKNALALIDWFIKWRDGVGVGDISISAYSVEGDRRSLAASHERMNNIAKIINKLNKSNVPVKFRDRAPVPARGPFAFLSNRVVVAVQPACLKTNTCCSQPITQQDNP